MSGMSALRLPLSSSAASLRSFGGGPLTSVCRANASLICQQLCESHLLSAHLPTRLRAPEAKHRHRYVRDATRGSGTL